MSGDATGARRVHAYIDSASSFYIDVPAGSGFANMTDDEIADCFSADWAELVRDEMTSAHVKHSYVRVECSVHSQPQITGFPSIEGGSTE